MVNFSSSDVGLSLSFSDGKMFYVRIYFVLLLKLFFVADSATNKDICYLDPDLGGCNTFNIKYFYNRFTGECHEFVFGGCLGNNNNFETLEECQEFCAGFALEKTCNKKGERGPCDGYLVRGVFSKENMKWVFLVSFEFYIIFAVFGESKNRCYLPVSYGNCTAIFVKWYYETLDGTCREFKYSGCGGNMNKFETYEDCYEVCMEDEEKKATSVPNFDPNIDRNRKRSMVNLTSHALNRTNDNINGREYRNLKNIQEKRKRGKRINRKNENKSININQTNRSTERNKINKLKNDRIRKHRVRSGQRRFNKKKNARKSTADAKDYNKRRNVNKGYKNQRLIFRIHVRENKTKNAQIKRENKNNCPQWHNSTGKSRG
ncbi:Tissue factor pathway inhibitor like protein [Argiope bruennichi]|uniref:Tissue factor pathway inhibitor like protein n=1 Tax=Argiope bruennichi TaxID=94029 RepID=A0A8T0E325_ARGBR|nr:Tissue factor pathway inhibitor like protein [Argiope bruennichi]